ncbi:MAG: cache domain-containing protein [Candidatus Marinarcus sp.]|uniref:sensor histidine kinase n=1 Tax=Candidatus Marinarcus sp. TaxID=3100987 RepID=UPI003AFFB70F
MLYKNEQTILKIIKYAPSAFVIVLALSILILSYFENKVVYEENKIKLQKNFIASNKERIKIETEKIKSYILKEHSLIEEKLKQSLKERIYEAHDIVMEIYRQNKHKGEKEVTKLIKDALRNIRFNNGRGYFFIYNYDYTCILLPINPSLEGENVYNFKDAKGRYLGRDIIASLEPTGESFLTWWFPKPNDLDHAHKKIGFNIHFKPYNWFIGTGEYVDEFEEDFKKDVLENLERMNSWHNSYLFIVNYEGDLLLYPNKAFQGKNIFSFEDNTMPASKNDHFFQQTTTKEIFPKFKELAQKSGGFLTYIHNKNSQKFVEKTSYVDGIQAWHWIIGNGFYEDDLRITLKEMKESASKNFEAHLFRIFIITFIASTILLIVSTYISHILKNKFTEYKKSIQKQIEQNSMQQNIMAQQSKMAAMGEMISNIAHQWRQPLSVITTSITGLGIKHEMGNLTKQEFESVVNNINHSAQYLSQTIDDFRNFFKSEKKKQHFVIEEVIEKTLMLVNSQFKNRGITIIKNIQPIEVCTFKNELIQVLINILNNAKDELDEKSDEKLIFIETLVENECLVIKIKDNGNGISIADINRIFEPYFSTKKAKDGTGIGLYMSQEIITKHMDGTIEALNVEYDYNEKRQKGALFTLTIPLGTKD